MLNKVLELDILGPLVRSSVSGKLWSKLWRGHELRDLVKSSMSQNQSTEEK